MSDYSQVTSAADLPRHAGQRVSLIGRLTTLQWARMSAFFPDHPHENLLEAVGSRLVVYTREPITATGDVEVRGRVHALRGSPGSRAEGRTEYSIIADAWMSLD